MEKHIRDLIRQGENGEIEFKKTISSLSKIAKTISAMANSRGGTLLVGVNDQGVLVGTSVDEEEFMLGQAANWYIKPSIALTYQEYTDEHNKSILVVSIPCSPDKPHACLSVNNEWQFYIRSQDKCVKASDLVLKAITTLPAYEDLDQEGDLLTPNVVRLQDYLHNRKRITLTEYAKLINVSKRRANRILVDLVRDRKLYQHTYEKAIFYTLTT